MTTMMLLQVIFWMCILALFHSYILYPLLLKLLSGFKKENLVVYPKDNNLPSVTILMAVYNEEKVIAEKIESIFNSVYPKEKIQLLIGSDNSTDKTNELIKNYCLKFPQIEFKVFESRQGKIQIVNQLFKKATSDILIITDANVLFDKQSIYELIKHFKNETIALVDSNMINKGLKKEGISIQEKTYINFEVQIKNAEGKLWGCMMGPFGGCYAVRKNYFSIIPPNFLVDDFYINMKVLQNGGKCINEKNAFVYEDVSNELSEEFRRKIRIATGNFQNLFAFFSLLLKFNSISFCFFSHKVLRWLGPLFLLFSFISSFLLKSNEYYYGALLLSIAFYLLPLLDLVLKKINIHVSLLRFITHFLSMNLALFIGMFKFFKGVKSSVWQPTKRHQ